MTTLHVRIMLLIRCKLYKAKTTQTKLFTDDNLKIIKLIYTKYDG
jgi:hypothetical protein